MVLHVFVPHRKIDGRVYVGEVKEKDKAKQQYEKAVSTGKTAGLVKYAGMQSSEEDEAVAEASSSLSSQGIWKEDGEVFGLRQHCG